jgi:hypothetical protein
LLRCARNDGTVPSRGASPSWNPKNCENNPMQSSNGAWHHPKTQDLVASWVYPGPERSISYAAVTAPPIAQGFEQRWSVWAAGTWRIAADRRQYRARIEQHGSSVYGTAVGGLAPK